MEWKSLEEFMNENSLSTVKKLLMKIDQTGTVDHKPASGKSVRLGLLRTLI